VIPSGEDRWVHGSSDPAGGCGGTSGGASGGSVHYIGVLEGRVSGSRLACTLTLVQQS